MKKLITCLLLVLVAAPLALAQGGSNDIKENDVLEAFVMEEVER